MKCEKCGTEVGNAGALAQHKRGMACDVIALRRQLFAEGMKPAGSRWQYAKKNGGSMFATHIERGFRGKRAKVVSQWWLPADA